MEINKNDEEFVEFYGIENHIKDIYFERETNGGAIMFGRQKDDKIFFIPKSAIRGPWKKNKVFPQSIKVKFGIKLIWRERRYKGSD